MSGLLTPWGQPEMGVYRMPLLLTLFNGVNAVLPYRGFFAVRRVWLRCAGLSIGPGVRIATGAKFYDKYISIGEETWIGPEVSVLSSAKGTVSIGRHVDIAPCCKI